MTDFLANTTGLAVQAKLGEETLLQAGMAAEGMKPNCSFSYPPVTDARIASHQCVYLRDDHVRHLRRSGGLRAVPAGGVHHGKACGRAR